MRFIETVERIMVKAAKIYFVSVVVVVILALSNHISTYSTEELGRVWNEVGLYYLQGSLLVALVPLAIYLTIQKRKSNKVA